MMLVLATAVLAGLLAARVWFRPPFTVPFVDALGKPVPGSIACLERVMLGGVAQGLLIRGLSVANPVLLYLHGGPGTSELGMVRAHNIPVLEKHFTVVVWDQRGAGMSYAAREPESGMSVEQFIADAHELTLLLCRRFQQPKIYLVGHSWGSALGALTVHRYPDLYHAYVGVGQVVDMREGERISYAWTLAQAEQAGDARSVAHLKTIGPPPYLGKFRSKLMAQRRILGKYGGEVHGNPRGGMSTLLRGLIGSCEYSWPDRINVFRGIFANMRLMWPNILDINLMTQVQELKVPVYFLLGCHDYEAPSVLAEQYFQVLKAPQKTLIWFERSAHFVNTEEADSFNRFFVDRLLRETYPRDLGDTQTSDAGKMVPGPVAGSRHASERRFLRALRPGSDQLPRPGMRLSTVAGLVCILGLAAAAVTVRSRFLDDMGAAAARASQGSTLIETRCGPIEYQEAGAGIPLLVVHGGGGGHDQGMALVRRLTTRGVRVIAMSRFGYLRTPMPADASAAAQADAHACLLDALGIERIGVLGGSAGAPSALQMAVHHPDRVSALILLVPIAYKPATPADSTPHVTPWIDATVMSVIGSDFLVWSGLHLARDRMIEVLLATPPDLLETAAPAERARVNAMLDDILPVSRRAAGLRADSAISRHPAPAPLELIRAPTLIVSARDDGYGTYASAEYTAGRIAGSRFIGFEQGGHTLVGHDDEVMAAIVTLLVPADGSDTP